MKAEEFLDNMGWPKDRMGEAGLAKWSGSSADGFSAVIATIARVGDRIDAKIDRVGLDGAENMLTLEGRVELGFVAMSKSHAGDPPEAIPSEDAIHLFKFMSSGLGKFAFESSGPMALPASKGKPGQ